MKVELFLKGVILALKILKVILDQWCLSLNLNMLPDHPFVNFDSTWADFGEGCYGLENDTLNYKCDLLAE